MHSTKKLTYEYVKNYIESFKGYKLLSDNYIHVYIKLKVKHDIEECGYEYEVCFHDFKGRSNRKGSRCPRCSGKQRCDYTNVKKAIENRGYILLSDDYRDNKSKLNIRCDKGHVYQVRFDNFLHNNCPFCKADKARTSFDIVRNAINSVEGYELLSDNYKNFLSKLEIKCNKGHVFKMNFRDFKGSLTIPGHRCSECSKHKYSSKPEIEIADYCSIFTTVERNNRNIIRNPLTNRFLELDIWIPQLNKAIEFNGTYWHSKKDILIKDQIKLQQCKEKGIQLLVIEEEKWLKNRQECLDTIKAFLIG